MSAKDTILAQLRRDRRFARRPVVGVVHAAAESVASGPAAGACLEDLLREINGLDDAAQRKWLQDGGYARIKCAQWAQRAELLGAKEPRFLNCRIK